MLDAPDAQGELASATDECGFWLAQFPAVAQSGRRRLA